MLFVKKETKNVLPVLTSEQAMGIYEGLKTKDANRLFLEDNIPTEYTVEVMKEIQRLESEMVAKMNGSFKVTDKIPAEYDEEGNETKAAIPATYYLVTTEAELEESMASELLTINTVVTDIRIWSDGNPDATPTWTDYKASLTGDN